MRRLKIDINGILTSNIIEAADQLRPVAGKPPPTGNVIDNASWLFITLWEGACPRQRCQECP
ncbi:hypothetical protein PSCICN_04740 [Pseudomonas cichorii]|nr:hypothetical protein PSCICN_04740 [Pseudomonas cichorii]